MVNNIEEAVVPLAGRGYVFRRDDQYLPGEYSNLVNMYMSSSGSLRTRQAAQVFIMDPAVTPMFAIGNYKSCAIYSSNNLAPAAVDTTSMFTVTQTNTVQYATFKTNALAVRPTAGTDGGVYSDPRVTVLGWFEYNAMQYAITQVTYRIMDMTYAYVVVMTSGADPKGPNDLFKWDAYTPGDRIWSDEYYMGVSWYSTSALRYPQLTVKDWLVYKDRLWLIIDDTLYGSAVSNPELFSVVNDGYFVRFPGNELKDIEAVADQLYVVSDSSIYSVSYQVDPNLDSEVTIISSVIGGEAATTLGDVVYVAKAYSIYAVSGLRVEKVFSLELPGISTKDLSVKHTFGVGFNIGSSFDVCLEAMEESLYISYRFIVPIVGPNIQSYYDVQYSYVELGGPSVSPTEGVYKLDTSTGMLSLYTFGNNGLPLDFKYIPVEDSFNQTKIAFVSGYNLRYGNRTFTLGTRPRHVRANPTLTNPSIHPGEYQSVAVDMVANPVNHTQLFAERFETIVGIRNFSPPDVSRYLNKKFRNIQLDIRVPLNSEDSTPFLVLGVSAGDDVQGTQLGKIIDTFISPAAIASGDSVESETLRYGFNQRCKKITIFLISEVEQYSTLDLDPTLPYWSLRDIRTLWMLTARGPANDVLGS